MLAPSLPLVTASRTGCVVQQKEPGCCQGKLFGSSFAPLLPAFLGSVHQGAVICGRPLLCKCEVGLQ
jgi:hypothetical protein